MNVSISDAKAILDELVKKAEAGEPIVLTRDGAPVAELTAKPAATGKKQLLGAFKGLIWMAPDFDELGPEWDEYVK